MALRSLSGQDLAAALRHMLGEARYVLVEEPKLAPWIGDLEAALALLEQALAGHAAPAPTEESLRTLERRSEAAVRALHLAVGLYEAVAIAQGDTDETRHARAVRASVFATGLPFVASSAVEQHVDVAEVFEAAANLDLATILGDLRVKGRSFNDLVLLACSTNAALADHLLPSVPFEELPPGPSLGQARRHALSLLTTIERTATMALPDAQPDKAARRRVLFEGLSKRAQADETT